MSWHGVDSSMNCELLECAVGEGEANLRVQSPETFVNFETTSFQRGNSDEYLCR